MRAVTTQLSQRVETLMELPPPAETRPAASEPRAAAVVPKPAPAPAPPAAPVAPAAVVQPELAELDLKLGELAELLNNIEVRDRRPGRRFGPPPDGRGPGRPEGGPFVAPAPPGPPAASPGAPASPNAPASAGTVPPATAGPPSGPRDGFERGGRSRPPPEARRAGELPPGQVDDPEDPKRIRIDLHLVRRELFNELVTDREAFDALPLEEKQKVFAKIEQRMAGVAQGIKVLQNELASRAVDVRTQDTAAAAVAGATSQSVAATPPTAPVPAPAPPPAPPRTARTARVAAAPVAPPPVAPPSAKAPAPVTKRSTQMSGKRFAVKVERDGQVVGQVNADIDLPKLLATVFAKTRASAARCRSPSARRRALHADAGGEAEARGAATSALSAGSAPGTTVLPDWIVVTMPDPTGSGLKFGIARPVGDALDDLRRTTARNAGLGLCSSASRSSGSSRCRRADAQPRLAERRRRPHRAGRLQRARAGAIERRDRPARRRVQPDGRRRRAAPAVGSGAGADPPRARAGPADPARHAAARAAAFGLTEVKGVSVPAREVGGDFFNYFRCATAASRCSSATCRARASAPRC